MRSEYELLNVAAIDVTPPTVESETSNITDEMLSSEKPLVELIDADQTPSAYNSPSASVLAYRVTSNSEPGSNAYVGRSSHIFTAAGREKDGLTVTANSTGSDSKLFPDIVATIEGFALLPSKNRDANCAAQSLPPMALLPKLPQLIVCEVTPLREMVNVTLLLVKRPKLLPCVQTHALT